MKRHKTYFSEKEIKVLSYRENDKMTFVDIGRTIGVSNSRASQIYQRAVRKRKYAEQYPGEPFDIWRSVRPQEAPVLEGVYIIMSGDRFVKGVKDNDLITTKYPSKSTHLKKYRGNADQVLHDLIQRTTAAKDLEWEKSELEDVLDPNYKVWDNASKQYVKADPAFVEQRVAYYTAKIEKLSAAFAEVEAKLRRGLRVVKYTQTFT